MQLDKITVIDTSEPFTQDKLYNKHGNKKAWINLAISEKTIYTPLPAKAGVNIELASILEAKVFLYLRDLDSRLNRNLATISPTLYFVLLRQVSINLLPKDTNGIKLTHVVDFALSLRKSDDKEIKTIATWYIEAKGKPTDLAIAKWKILESNLGLFNANLYYVIGTPRKQVKTILNHSIYPLQQGLDALEISINEFLTAYQSINGKY